VSTTRPSVTIAALTAADWDDVARIYAEGIATGNATFETEVPDWPAWDAAHLPSHRLVGRTGTGVAGWAALSPVSSRCVYAGVAEVSVYVAAAARGQGVGTELLQALVGSSEQGGIWTLQAGLFPENEASLRLHTRAGFRVVGTHERLSKLHGVWRDVVLLERRSAVVE
jgi:phosphinothricin acetyltransferase